MPYNRKYATATTGGKQIAMPLMKSDGSGWLGSGDWTPADGDVKVDKDFAGTPDNIATLPAAFAIGSKTWWIFTLSAGEVTSESTVVSIDNAALASDGFVVETFGHASAMFPDDLSVASPTITVTGGKVSINIDEGDIDGDTIIEVLRVLAAVGYGDGTGLNGATKVFKAVDGSKTRVTDAYNSTTGARTITADATP